MVSRNASRTATLVNSVDEQRNGNTPQSSMASRRVLSFLVASSLMVGAFPAFAQGKKGAKSAPAPHVAPASSSPEVANGKKDDKVDISDLENKYWAPKDTDFSVVQNRTYTKEHRFFLTGHLGRPVNDQWSVGNTYGLSGNYFFNERMGIQATWLKAGLSNNEAADFIASHYGTGIYADHNRLSSYVGVGFNLVPFYAKMSFWGKKIIYFDMAFTPTLGFTNYEQQIETGNKTKGSFTYGLDVTQYFFFTNYFALRADLKNQWHNEEIAAFHGNSAQGTKTGEKVKDQTAQDTLFLLGFTFFY